MRLVRIPSLHPCVACGRLIIRIPSLYPGLALQKADGSHPSGFYLTGCNTAMDPWAMPPLSRELKAPPMSVIKCLIRVMKCLIRVMKCS